MMGNLANLTLLIEATLATRLCFSAFSVSLRMAYGKNSYNPPLLEKIKMKEITIPAKLAPLVKAFSCNSEETSKALVIEAAKAIYGTEKDRFEICAHKVTDDELENIVALMKALDPQDVIESIYAAQIVVSHMLGMKKLAKDYPSETSLGLKLMRFSMEAMSHLQKKRCGTTQHITVNYNYNGQGNAIMQAVIPKQQQR